MRNRLRQVLVILGVLWGASSRLAADEYFRPLPDTQLRLGDLGNWTETPWGLEGTEVRGYLQGEWPAGEPEEDGPPILPEPMVFDLIRPLGARRGEREVNVLGMVPLNRSFSKAGVADDPLGIVPRSPDRRGIEWAPEIEVALWDGFAVEFELPFEEARLEAYKAAAQWTFGTGLNNQFIHGTQVIVQYDVDEPLWTPTFLYLAGLKIDPVWSLLMMYGFRTEFAGRGVQERTETILNVSLFAEVTERFTLGMETNYAGAMSGVSTWLAMPQIHWDISERLTLQGGVGARFTEEFTLPEAAFRVISEF
jgi:hypothetical protein